MLNFIVAFVCFGVALFAGGVAFRAASFSTTVFVVNIFLAFINLGLGAFNLWVGLGLAA